MNYFSVYQEKKRQNNQTRRANVRALGRSVPALETRVESYEQVLFSKQTEKPVVFLSDSTKPVAVTQELNVVTDLSQFCAYVILGSYEASVVFNSMLEFISRESKNYTAFPESYMINGYAFQDAKQGGFQFQLFRFENQLGISQTRMDGCSFVIKELFTELKRDLYSHGLNDDEDCDFSDSDYSDDEDDVFSFDFDARFLNLAQDPEYVQQLIEDIGDCQCDEHALMLLAHNVDSANNYNYMQAHAQDIVNNCISRLSWSDSTLPVVRSAAKLINTFVTQENLSLSFDQFKIILSTVASWSTGVEDKTNFVTLSEEISMFLSTILIQIWCMVEIQTVTHDVVSFLNTMQLNSKYQEVRDHVDEFRTELNC